MNHNMYNTKFTCTYHDLETLDLQDCQYPIDFLQVFNVDTFDETKINNEVNVLFELLKKSPPLFQTCIQKSAAMFMSEDLHVGLMGLFSFDFLYLAHPCICQFLETGTITEENINALLSAL